MESDDLAGAAALRWSDSGWTDSSSTDSGWPDEEPPARQAAAADTEAAVGALYDDAAVGLIRLAYLMLGDRPSAEDVVQDAFFGLYRNWARLADHDRALAYVRSSVLNGCR